MDAVVSGDDAAARAQLRPTNPSGEDTGAKGPMWIGRIETLCDPGHRLKIFTKPLYAAEGEEEVSGNLGSVVIVCELQATPLPHV